MPTHEEEAQFLREFAALTPAQRARFLDATRKMVNDLRAGQPFRPSLRVKGVQGHPSVFEMSWTPDGERPFTMARPRGHEILKNP